MSSGTMIPSEDQSVDSRCQHYFYDNKIISDSVQVRCALILCALYHDAVKQQLAFGYVYYYSFDLNL